MFMVFTIGFMVAGGAIFGLLLPMEQFAKVLQPLIVALSIMAAGLLVRLNRGMPTLDWKSLDSKDRKILTGKIVELTREYLTVLAIQVFTLAVLLVLALVDPAHFSASIQKWMMALAGAAVALCLARMAYIVWRDYDIVRLQRKLIDDSADRETVEKASKDALNKVSAIREASFRPPPKPEASNWGD
jgi:lysylphosphatidylglycerol synthetase-like protein (DUF2156 family)